MTEIQFNEDEAYESKLRRQKPIPDKGIEGFIYKKIPGKYTYKKAGLILAIILVFVIAFIFFTLGLQNLGDEPEDSFDARVENTRIR